MRRPASWTVFRFECSRTMTFGRVVVSGLLALFPVGLLGLMQYAGAHLERGQNAAAALFILIPQILSMLVLLFCATPVIQTELENRTWTYLAVRPASKGSVLLGKYFTATTWAMLTAIVSLTLTMGVVRPEVDVARTWFVLAALVVMACLAYGAVYVLLGVIFLQRGMVAMVAAAFYTFMFEFVLTWLPATIRQFTVQYHLRCLGVRWMGWDRLPRHVKLDRQLWLSEAPASYHLAAVLGGTLVLLVAAMLILRRRELIRANET